MSLDLSQIAAQISDMASALRVEEESWRRCLSRALEIFALQSSDIDSLRRKIEGSHGKIHGGIHAHLYIRNIKLPDLL